MFTLVGAITVAAVCLAKVPKYCQHTVRSKLVNCILSNIIICLLCTNFDGIQLQIDGRETSSHETVKVCYYKKTGNKPCQRNKM